MTVSPELLSILACPSPDHAPLRLDGSELVCTACLSRFPIRDGIPVLLGDEATPGPKGLGVPVDTATPGPKGLGVPAASSDDTSEPSG